MGFERTIVSAMISAALVPAASAHAGGAKEPLIITKVTDGAAIVLASNDAAKMSLASAETDETNSIDQAINSFARAAGDAIRAEQEATRAACKSADAPKAGTAAGFEWRARCSYVRR